MSKFTVTHITNPIDFKDDVIHFWDENLPGTPHARFDWMCEGNPAGPNDWFLAREEKSGDIAGMISIMPRIVTVSGDVFRIGILGDFMVSKEFRIFGPTIQLVKTALSQYVELGYKALYTVPNTESYKVLERVGFRDLGSIYYLVKPLDIGYYLNGKMPRMLQPWITPVMQLGLRMVSRETYVIPRGTFEIVTRADQSFESLWHTIRAENKDMIGDHGIEYLNWRFFSNPLFEFFILTYRDTDSSELLGYIVYTFTRGYLEIYDLVVADEKYIGQLIKRIVCIARQHNSRSIYISVYKNNPWLDRIKSYLFIDSQYKMNLYYHGDNAITSHPWYFFAGDRNI